MPYKLKHFLAFYLGGVAGSTALYLYIGDDYHKGSGFAIAATLLYAIYPIVVCSIMIATFRTEKQMFLLQKIVPSIIFVTLQILCTTALNWINPFDRLITQADFDSGTENNLVLGSIQIFVLLPVLYFIKPKKVSN